MARISKAQQELEALRLHCDRIETQLASVQAENDVLTAKVAELREYATRQKAVINAMREAKPATREVGNKPQPSQFSDYASYCGAARAWCRQQGHKVISMASREQFEAAQPCPV